MKRLKQNSKKIEAKQCKMKRKKNTLDNNHYHSDSSKSVEELHNFYAAPAEYENLDAALVPPPSQL
jgi:hypothetical protein